MKDNSGSTLELLLPVGNIESFYAALDGSANAIYFGMKNFNARNRAMNFSPWQAAAIVKEAHKKGIKSYITLNTVIRNFDLQDLINTLYELQQIKADAIIIQDLGVLYLIKKFFPDLKVHSSTQMAIHNSVGVEFMHQKGIERVVLARELTLHELKDISIKSKIDIELFVHGALCYSFSGMCLFSSYIGGSSANRGLCTQPCRRIYSQKNETGKNEKYFFSLKDNELIDYLDDLKACKVTSLKIEGRLKPGEYVHRVARAYRMAIDFPDRIEEARLLLAHDLGREKTSYFIGSDVGNAITQAATTGVLIGKVLRSAEGKITFTSTLELENGCRLRFRNSQNDKQIDLKADQLELEDCNYTILGDSKEIKQTYEVYLAGNKLKLPQKINTDGIQLKEHYSPDKLKNILNGLRFKGNPMKRELYLRIDSLAWLECVQFDQYTGVILQLTKAEWDILPLQSPLIQKNKEKIFIEFPKFIAEGKIGYYRDLSQKLFAGGMQSFLLSHLSQKLLLPAGSNVLTNENVYVFNDAAIRFVKENGVRQYVYPLENDIANLGRGTDRNGIVPVYFYPHLFYSRMPVDLERERVFTDKNGMRFKIHIRDGMRITCPENPVSITQYREKLERFGFNKFLVDMSFSEVSGEHLLRVMDDFNMGNTITGSSIFNFKRELK